MEPDKYQQAWQAQTAVTRVTVDADLLLQEVQRSQRQFRVMIFWRDFREVGVALLLLPLWFYLGATTSSPWTWYLTVPVLVWMAGFMLVYRIRHRQKPSQPDEPLTQCVKNSLTEVDDQIWLLRNIFWWYLLPPFISISAFFVHVGWSSSPDGSWLAALVGAAVPVVVLAAVYAALYYVNQYAVRSQLEPRRQELLMLLTSLRDETIGEGAGEHVGLPALPFAGERFRTPCASPARVALGIFGIFVIVAFLVVAINIDPYRLTGDGYPKRSPFAAVRWQEDRPEVKVGDEWFKLVSLDEISASEIVAFSRETYANKWRKRFEEDLVELLTRKGHPPQDTVTLVVQSPTSSETWILEDVPMTYANRRAIRNAAQARENGEP